MRRIYEDGKKESSWYGSWLFFVVVVEDTLNLFHIVLAYQTKSSHLFLSCS